jgi:hypothetical protein
VSLRLKTYPVLLLVFGLSLTLSAQAEAVDTGYVFLPPVDETRFQPLPTTRHQELLEELDYNGEPRPPEPPQDPDEKSAFKAFLERIELGPIDLGPVGNLILLLLLLTGLGYFIFRFLEVPRVYRSKAEREATRVDVSEIEEERLTLAETESLLSRAERNEQFRLAIRLQYLTLLKRLNELGLIGFARDKGNRAYLREMSQRVELIDGFRRLTRNFERNWYGRYPIDRLTYRLIAETYTDYHQHLDKYAKKQLADAE